MSSKGYLHELDAGNGQEYGPAYDPLLLRCNMIRRAARRDENHGEIEAIFRRMLADHVTDSSRWGDGAGDLFVSFGGESGPAFCCWIEIKRDSKASFTAMQIRFRNTHPGCHYRCETAEQAVTLCNYIRRQVANLAERAKGSMAHHGLVDPDSPAV